jgi:hypothetical protein
MTEHEMSRTLVKSLPELWAECSDAESLARHLGRFGEIRITRVEPDSAVAWEGEHASGTVRLDASNWGTRVTLTASPAVEVAPVEPVERKQPEPEPEPPIPHRRRRGLLARLRALFHAAQAPTPGPPPPVELEQPPDPPQPTRPAIDSQSALSAALDSLGQAHHRPFSRA